MANMEAQQHSEQEEIEEFDDPLRDAMYADAPEAV
jgi:hypothetical protein